MNEYVAFIDVAQIIPALKVDFQQLVQDCPFQQRCFGPQDFYNADSVAEFDVSWELNRCVVMDLKPCVETAQSASDAD